MANAKAHLPLWSASGIAVRWSALLADMPYLYSGYAKFQTASKPQRALNVGIEFKRRLSTSLLDKEKFRDPS